MFVKNTWHLLRQTMANWWEDNVTRLAASLAYYTIFAIAPLLVIAIFIAGILWGHDAAQRQVHAQMKDFVGEPTARAVQDMVRNASQTGSGLWATIIGVALLVYASTNVFASLQDSLNTIWEVKPDPHASWWATFRNRVFSFAMVLVIGFLLLVSLVISTVLSALINFIGGSGWFWQGINFLVFIPIAALLFAMIFKYLPDVIIRWSDVWIGAGVTAVLFAVGKLAIGLYLGQSSVTSVYGAAGSLVVLLIWVYYSALILFFGAEFTQVYARRFGRRIQPGEFAVPVTEEERAQQGIPSSREVENASRQKHRPRGVPAVSPRIPSAVEPIPAPLEPQHTRVDPTLIQAGLLPVDPVPYTRHHPRRFSPVVGAIISTATGLVLGGAGALVMDKLRERRRDPSNLDDRVEAVRDRLKEINRKLTHLAHNPG